MKMKASSVTSYELTLDKEEKQVLIEIMDFASRVIEDYYQWDMAVCIKNQLENKTFSYTLKFVSFEKDLFLRIIKNVASLPDAPVFAKDFERTVLGVLQA